MYKLEAGQYGQAAPVFRNLAEFHLSVAAVLAGTAPGEIWVDDANSPRLGFAITSEGYYLAGDVTQEASYTTLKQIIPDWAYLIFQPEAWEQYLPQVWTNQVARRHPRQHLQWQEQRLPHWRSRIPEGFQFVPIDRKFLIRLDLINYADIAGWVAAWGSVDYFLEHGLGFCLLHGNTIASWCLTDCILEDKCEIGIRTDPRYRRQGLAATVVAGMVEHCLSRGFRQIGWHCLSSNAGSLAVAERVGFAKIHDYFSYSSGLPAENAKDLTPAEFADWARHYEMATAGDCWYHLHAADAWALAGQPRQALVHLQELLNCKFQVRLEWLENNWRLNSLRNWAEFEAMLESLRQAEEG